MKTKTVYCIRTRVDDNSEWDDPEYFLTRKERDKAGGFMRCIGGFRTHSYEEVKNLEEIETLFA